MAPCWRIAEIGRRLDAEAVGRAERFGLHQRAIEDHRHGETEHGEENLAVACQQETDEVGGEAGE